MGSVNESEKVALGALRFVVGAVEYQVPVAVISTPVVAWAAPKANKDTTKDATAGRILRIRAPHTDEQAE